MVVAIADNKELSGMNLQYFRRNPEWKTYSRPKLLDLPSGDDLDAFEQTPIGRYFFLIMPYLIEFWNLHFFIQIVICSTFLVPLQMIFFGSQFFLNLVYILQFGPSRISLQFTFVQVPEIC